MKSGLEDLVFDADCIFYQGEEGGAATDRLAPYSDQNLAATGAPVLRPAEPDTDTEDRKLAGLSPVHPVHSSRGGDRQETSPAGVSRLECGFTGRLQTRLLTSRYEFVRHDDAEWAELAGS